jgi:hypothetical protein
MIHTSALLVAYKSFLAFGDELSSYNTISLHFLHTDTHCMCTPGKPEDSRSGITSVSITNPQAFGQGLHHACLSKGK